MYFQPMKKWKSWKDLPQLNHVIQFNTGEACDDYQNSHKMLETAHEEYRSQTLDAAFSAHQQQLWKYIHMSYEEEYIFDVNINRLVGVTQYYIIHKSRAQN